MHKIKIKSFTKKTTRLTVLPLFAVVFVALATVSILHVISGSSEAYAQTKKITPIALSKPITATSKSTLPSKNAPIATNLTTGIKKTSSVAGVPKGTRSVAAPTVNSPSSSAPVLSSAQSLYVNSSSQVSTQAKAWASSNPSSASKMNRLASIPMASWFTDPSAAVQSETNSYVSSASAVGQLPVLVAYNIPDRDCSGQSSGGAASDTAYETWISEFAAGIGQRSAIVIVEPDALAGIDCLSSAGQQDRTQLISYAVKTLRNNTDATIYIDAGNSAWQPASTMASRLKAADIADATGFSLNVSNFQTTSSSNTYGKSLSSLVGGKHYVVDTSRNGSGPSSDNAWCNPSGVSFGNTPTLHTGTSSADAYLWIKAPGESDGYCGDSQGGTSAPSAGAWWAQYALMMESNSGW